MSSAFFLHEKYKARQAMISTFNNFVWHLLCVESEKYSQLVNTTKKDRLKNRENKLGVTSRWGGGWLHRSGGLRDSSYYV